MSLLRKKKKKVIHYHPTVFQAIVTETQVDFIDAIYSGNPFQKFKKIDKRISKTITSIKKEKSLMTPISDNVSFLVLETRLTTLQTLMDMIMKRYSEYEETRKTSDGNTQDTSGKDNNIQYS